MELTVIHSDRKTIAIEIHGDASVTVRAPLNATQEDIDHALKAKELWIQRHLDLIMSKRDNVQYKFKEVQKLSAEELNDLKAQASEYIPKRVTYYAKKIGVDYGRITVRNQKTRWGSCSEKGNLNFNCLIMLMPPDVIDYVVVHELCHRKHMNHSKRFWAEVKKVMPNYEEQIEWLMIHGADIMRRMERRI